MAAKLGPAYSMSNEHRDKIKNSNILNALIEHAQGDREMSPSQVTAGLGLLRKVMPDLSSVAHSGDDDAPAIKHSHSVEITIIDPKAGSRESVSPAPQAETV